MKYSALIAGCGGIANAWLSPAKAIDQLKISGLVDLNNPKPAVENRESHRWSSYEEFSRAAKVTRQTKRRIRPNGTLTFNDGSDSTVGNANIHGQAVLAQVQLIKEFSTKDCARMWKFQFAHVYVLLVGVDNLDQAARGQRRLASFN
jgi:hypothetical protein